MSVVDDAKRNVTIAACPTRIISLAPSATEMLFRLGLESKVVGVVSYSGYEASIQDAIKSQNITVVGTFSKVNVELVTGLQPDLILASGSYQQTLADKFAEQGKVTLMLNPTKISGILTDIQLLGRICRDEANATTLTSGMQSRIDAVVSKTSNLTKPSVYVEYYMDKTGYSSYASNSYVNELISMAGGVNVFSGFSGQYVTTSTEEVLKANPSIIIISKGAMSTLSGITPDSIKARECWGSISAIQNNQIYEVDESLITIWGPRIVDGLEALACVIHPEVFNATASPSPSLP